MTKQQKMIAKLLLLVPLVIILLIVGITSFYTVDETENAIVKTFGKVTSTKTAGLHWKLPAPIQTVRKEPVNKTMRLEIGYDPSTNEYILSESKMITGDFNIVNIDFFIEWKISNIKDYVYNSDNPENILKFLAQASARGIVGSHNVDGILTTDKDTIQLEVKEALIERLGVYNLGIQVMDIKIQDSEPPTVEVSEAFKAVETAKQEKETLVNEALAYKNAKLPDAESQADKLVRDAESYRESRINEARGEVAKFNSMFKEYEKNKKVTETRMYLEMIEEVFPNIPVYIESTVNGVQKMLPLKDFATTPATTEGGQ